MGSSNQVEKKRVDVDDMDELEYMDDCPVSFVTCSALVRRGERHQVMDQSADDLDSRIKITFGNSKFNYTSYTRLSQILCQLPDGRAGTGSGTRIIVKGVPYVLTCAHNLCSMSTLDDTTKMFKKARIYEGREGKDAWKQLWTLELEKSSIHPKYTGKTASGFDIGISRIQRRKHKFNGKVKIDDNLIQDDCDWGIGDLKDIESGMKVEVAGYSGQKDSFGYPYTHEGTILGKRPTENGGCILYYKLNTIPGNSGACIMIKNKSYIRKHCKKPGVSKLIIGVHNGYDFVDGVNYGMLITEPVFSWMTSRK